MKNNIISGSILLVLILILVSGGRTALTTGASGQPNYARVATTSTLTVGPQQVITIFDNKNFCAGRFIGVRNESVKISFGSSTPPSNTIGFPLSASSTNALASEIYGCSSVTGYAAASTTITIGETLY